MRIALVSPYSLAPMRGNITTVRRIARNLENAGAVTVNLAADSLSVKEMAQLLEDFKPDLIHGFHAHYCGAITRQLAKRFRLSYVITMLGSDINDPLLRNHTETVITIENARAVVCFNSSDADFLTECFPRNNHDIKVIPQGVEPLPVVKDDTFGLAHDDFVLLLPAALRAVKQIAFPLKSLPRLVRFDSSIRLLIAGGVIDQDYAASLRSLLIDNPFAEWLGEVPHERMGSLYDRAGLVLNCSLNESMPNCIMEAMALGKPVLAANIPGNRSLVQHGENGWLYDGEEDFRKQVLNIRKNETMRRRVGARAREFMIANFSPKLEAERYLSIYRELT